jgi:hypothetical protein
MEMERSKEEDGEWLLNASLWGVVGRGRADSGFFVGPILERMASRETKEGTDDRT